MSAIAAVIVLAVVALSSFAVLGGGGSSGFSVETGVGTPDVRALELGTSRDDVESELGPGEDALEFAVTSGGTRTAVEPMDATCVYYSAFATDARGPIQLCYRDDRLVSKRVYR